MTVHLYDRLTLDLAFPGLRGIVAIDVLDTNLEPIPGGQFMFSGDTDEDLEMTASVKLEPSESEHQLILLVSPPTNVGIVASQVQSLYARVDG